MSISLISNNSAYSYLRFVNILNSSQDNILIRTPKLLKQAKVSEKHCSKRLHNYCVFIQKSLISEKQIEFIQLLIKNNISHSPSGKCNNE